MTVLKQEDSSPIKVTRSVSWIRGFMKEVSGLLERAKERIMRRVLMFQRQERETDDGEVNQMSNYEGLLREYKDLPGGIIQAFHAIQKESGYLTDEIILAAARVFGVPAKDAYEVASFYSYFSTKPRGRNIIRICESAPCHVAGANEVIAALEKELGIRVGETTSDGKFTLELTECVGQCQDTPVITVNGEPFGNVSADKVGEILARF